jgi:predicted MPP superfamily phosphohydrolase
MSPELLLIPLLLGHVALFVLAVNVVHGLGHPERVMTPVKVALVAAGAVVSLALAREWWHGPLPGWSWPARGYAAVCVAAGAAFPVVTAYLHRRRRPEGVSGRSYVVRPTAFDRPDAFVGTGRHAWMLRLPGNESVAPHKVEWDVPIPGLPAALDGLTVLHLSDLHFTPSFDRRFFEAVAQAAAWPESDLVVFTGDLIDDDEVLGWVEPVLSRVRGRHGTFSVLGNHDLEHQPGRVREALAGAGFTDLDGRWATASVRGATVALAGTMYPWGPRLALDSRPEADFRVLLSHSPDQFYWAERSGFDLMLSGHVHGGQVRLPLVGAVFMPSVYSRRFDRGFFRKGGLTLHVSRGVAAQHPVRYNCPPEIGRLTLRRAGHTPGGSSNGVARASATRRAAR